MWPLDAGSTTPGEGIDDDGKPAVLPQSTTGTETGTERCSPAGVGAKEMRRREA
jgi:hypothetical protein